MFAYIDTDSFLHRRNPIIKLLIIIVMTICVCVSYFPVFPFITFAITFLTIWIAGNIPLGNLLRRLLLFFVISLSFMFSMLILRGFNGEYDIVLQLGFLKWSETDLIHSFTLGIRILALVTMSMGFVLTTKPRDLVLSLIIQCKVPVVYGYATMATYRFLPELQEQVDAIHLAQEIRGIPWNKGIVARMTSPFRVSLPLFCLAARRGERVACSMESRGLGRDTTRSFYKKTWIDRGDLVFLIIALLVYILIMLILLKLDLFKYNFAAIK